MIAKLQQLGADVTPVKTGIINPIIIPEFADKVRSADWIVFTSKNGVRSFSIIWSWQGLTSGL